MLLINLAISFLNMLKVKCLEFMSAVNQKFRKFHRFAKNDMVGLFYS